MRHRFRPSLVSLFAIVSLWFLAYSPIGIAGIAPSGGAVEPVEDYDLWYVLEVDGHRAGWSRERVEVRDDAIVTLLQTQMRVRRGELVMSIEVVSEFEETPAHKPLRWKTRVVMGAEPIEREYVFHEDRIESARREGGREVNEDLPPLDRPWLTPAGVRELLARRIASGTGEISYTTLDPTQGLILQDATLRGFEDAPVEVMGRVVPATRCVQRFLGLGGLESVVHVDAMGRFVRTEVALAGMHIVTLAADRELALSEVEAPELMARTFVRPERAIPHARRSTDATYLLRVREGEMPDLPQTSSQRVERIDARTLRVRVREGARFDGGVHEGEPEAGTLARSAMLDWEDPRIQDLARRGAAGGDRPGADMAFACERMRQVAFRHIRKKDLGVGFASASEVVRSGQGDCSEHAALLAAMLRARAIPSRVVSGLVYVGEFMGERDIFGYHMWVQALLDVDGQKRWVDLDPSIGGSDAFDATHIALVVSNLSDDEGSNALIALAPLMGRLEIEVEHVE